MLRQPLRLSALLYGSLAATTGGLLRFALTALAILVALPSTERLEVLRRLWGAETRFSCWERAFGGARP